MEGGRCKTKNLLWGVYGYFLVQLHNLHYIQTGAVYVIYGCICGHFAVVMHFSKGYSVMYRD